MGARRAVGLALGFAVGAIAAASVAAPTAASPHCVGANLAGEWRNPNARAGELSKIEVEHRCLVVPDAVRGEKGVDIWTVRPFHRCRPADCHWGREDGKANELGAVVAQFETFAASRILELSGSGSILTVRFQYFFRDGTREPETGQVIFVRR